MSSVEKGNQLEDTFYEYLLDQKENGSLVFGAYPHDNCKIFKKKSYENGGAKVGHGSGGIVLPRAE